MECELCEFVLKVFDSEMIKNSTEVSIQEVVGMLHAVHVIACEYMYIQEFAGNCAVYTNIRIVSFPAPYTSARHFYSRA